MTTYLYRVYQSSRNASYLYNALIFLASHVNIFSSRKVSEEGDNLICVQKDTENNTVGNVIACNLEGDNNVTPLMRGSCNLCLYVPLTFFFSQ